MKKLFFVTVLAAAVLCAPVFAAPIIIDHRHTDITQLSSGQLARAKAVLHIAYGHTSHGSQLTDGMSGLVGFANGGGLGLSYPNNFFAWNNGGTGGALDLHDYAMGGDVGYYPDWVNNTVAYLNNPANADVNVIIPRKNYMSPDMPTASGGSFYHVMVQLVDLVRVYLCDVMGITNTDIIKNHNNLE